MESKHVTITKNNTSLRGNGKDVLYILIILSPFVAGLLCIGLGRYSLTAQESIQVLFSGLFRGSESVSDQAYSVIFNIRLPRVLLALACGAGLSVSGAAYQSLLSNPLAASDTLGVAAGTSFGACLAMLLKANLMVMQLSALCFGLLSVAITFSIGRKNGKTSNVSVILAGIVVAAMFQAFLSIVKYVADPENDLPSITYWLMGSMTNASYRSLAFGVPPIAIGALILYLLRWRLNILSLNEDEAESMGIAVQKLRMVVLFAATLITASCTSMCGLVGWVGLLIPHIIRMIYGVNNQRIIPASIFLGALFMLIIDTVARTATKAEIPISILTALIGAPFFIALLRRNEGGIL